MNGVDEEVGDGGGAIDEYSDAKEQGGGERGLMMELPRN